MNSVTSVFRVMSIVLFLGLVAACAGGPEIHTHRDLSADFSSYQTYAFFGELGTATAGYSEEFSTILQEYIGREMQNRGYRHETEDPDLIVNVFTNLTDATGVVPGSDSVHPVFSFGYYGYRNGQYGAWDSYRPGTGASTVHYEMGTLNIDVIDASSNIMVWEGIARGSLQADAMQNPEQALSETISRVFERYPVSLN